MKQPSVGEEPTKLEYDYRRVFLKIGFRSLRGASHSDSVSPAVNREITCEFSGENMSQEHPRVPSSE